jgi:uncharacterized protein (DUF58 family)
MGSSLMSSPDMLHGRLSQLLFRGPLVVLRRTSSEAVVTIELRQALPVAACLAALVWYLMAPTDVAAMGAAALACLVIGAYLWARAMATHVTARRRLYYTALQVGDEIEELITLVNDSGLPVIWAEFADQSNLPSYAVSSVRMADWHSTVEWRAHTVCTQRGMFTLGPWELRLGDPFGLFLVRQRYLQRQEILIYPPLAPLPPHLLPHTATVGAHRPLRQPLPAHTINAVGVRPYVPGDALRHVHWRTTARRQSVHTKLFEPEASSTIWLIPDFDPAAHTGEGADSTEEAMVLLTASLASQLLKMHLSVGLLAYTDRLAVLAPRPGAMQLWPLLRTLAPLHPVPPSPEGPPRDLAQALVRAQPLFGVGDLVIVITPALTGDWPVVLRRSLHHGGAAEALIIDSPAGEAGQAEAACAALMGLGLPARVVRRGELRPLATAYGALRRWEFRTLGTGRVVIQQRPREAGGRAGWL